MKKVDILTMKSYEEAGLVKLKYLDEAGFCLESPVSYTYVKRGEQKEINQLKSRGKRLSILGVFQENESFEYALKVGSFKNQDYIEFMNWQAQKARENYLKTGAITVIIQDNYSVHKSQEVKKHLDRWKEQGLEFFFLSAYSPELNLIETEWHQLKTHELAGRMFEDNYDLAMAVKQGITNRSKKHNRNCEMFKFS